MARFTYRMQSILNIKIQLENQAKMEFGQAQARLNAEEEKLQQLKDRKEAYLEEGRILRGSGIDVLKLKENETALKVSDELIYGQLEQVKIAARAVERAREKLTTVMQERKAQERLREKAFENFLEEEKRAEAKEVDELVSYRYGLKDSEEDGSGRDDA